MQLLYNCGVRPDFDLTTRAHFQDMADQVINDGRRDNVSILISHQSALVEHGRGITKPSAAIFPKMAHARTLPTSQAPIKSNQFQSTLLRTNQSD